eukprot:COSAG05_NODE_626_length_8254_cov_12.820846_2_plen_269_part_00
MGRPREVLQWHGGCLGAACDHCPHNTHHIKWLAQTAVVLLHEDVWSLHLLQPSFESETEALPLFQHLWHARVRASRLEEMARQNRQQKRSQRAVQPRTTSRAPSKTLPEPTWHSVRSRAIYVWYFAAWLGAICPARYLLPASLSLYQSQMISFRQKRRQGRWPTSAPSTSSTSTVDGCSSMGLVLKAMVSAAASSACSAVMVAVASGGVAAHLCKQQARPAATAAPPRTTGVELGMGALPPILGLSVPRGVAFQEQLAASRVALEPAR